jgi:hypothetical protein
MKARRSWRLFLSGGSSRFSREMRRRMNWSRTLSKRACETEPEHLNLLETFLRRVLVA